jgi:hypothetical protein
MNKQDLVNLLEDADNSDPMLYHRVTVRLAQNEPRLQSLLWMLREGVIGRGHFQQLVVATEKN